MSASDKEILTDPERGNEKPTGIIVHPSIYLEEAVRGAQIDQNELQKNAHDLANAPIQTDLKVLLHDAPYDTDSDTIRIVGASGTGKTSIAEKTANILGIGTLENGINYRAALQIALANGYNGGEFPPSLIAKITQSLDHANLRPARPNEGVPLIISIPDMGDFSYVDLAKLTHMRDSLQKISEIPDIHHAASRNLQRAAGKDLVIIGGRELRPLFPKALVDTFIARNGVINPEAERNQTWGLDQPSAGTIILLNFDGQLDLSAQTLAAITAKRTESRVSSDNEYPLFDNRVILLTSEKVKAEEYAAAAKKFADIPTAEPFHTIPQAVLKELQQQALDKALHAHKKFPDKELLVDVTALYSDYFTQQGLPPELIQWGSTHAIDNLLKDLPDGRTPAYAITYGAFIDREGKPLALSGIVKGQLLQHPQGEKGIGWDPYFLPNDQTHTYGENYDDKQSSSSRAIVTKKLGHLLGVS